MSHLGAAMVGVLVGLFFGALAQNALDDRAVRDGWMTHKHIIYLITPAKPVPAQ